MDVQQRPEQPDRLGWLPPWLCLISACAMLAAVVLVPPWLQCRQLAWQRDLLQRQLEQLDRQRETYRSFVAAIDDGDPVVLERLAYHHLHVKPRGRQLVGPAPFQPAATVKPTGSNRDPNLDPTMATIGGIGELDWLHQPLPTIGVDYPAWQPVQSRLVRITTGRARLGVVALAGLCLLLAWMTLPQNRRRTADEGHG